MELRCMDSSPRRPPLPVVLRQGGGDVLTVNHIYAQRFKKNKPKLIYLEKQHLQRDGEEGTSQSQNC